MLPLIAHLPACLSRTNTGRSRATPLARIRTPALCLTLTLTHPHHTLHIHTQPWYEAPFSSRRNIVLTMLGGSAALLFYNKSERRERGGQRGPWIGGGGRADGLAEADMQAAGSCGVRSPPRPFNKTRNPPAT